jgi:hypothetical protein
MDEEGEPEDRQSQDMMVVSSPMNPQVGLRAATPGQQRGQHPGHDSEAEECGGEHVGALRSTDGG